MDVEVPNDFWFFYGESLNEIARYEDSKDSIIAYLNVAGRNGENYHQALELLDTIEPKAEQEVQAAKIRAEKDAENRALSSAINATGFCKQNLDYDAITKGHRKSVSIQDSHSEFIQTPATFETISETIIIKPSAPEGTTFKELKEEYYVAQEAFNDLSVVDTEYKILEKTVNFGNDSKGQPMMESYQKRVVETPSTPVERRVPAVTKSFTRYKIKKKGKSNTIVPATTKIITRRVLKKPSKIRQVNLPGITKVIHYTEVLREPNTAEAEVLCDYKSSPILIKLLQENLKKRNIFDGETNGVWSADLDDALGSFQSRNSFGRGPYLSKEVLEALGIKRR